MNEQAPPPPWWGCFKCGKVWPAEPSKEAVFACCEVCGKTVGICVGCARQMFFRRFGVFLGTTVKRAHQFIEESMDWHLEQLHHYPPRAERVVLDRMPKTRLTVELF